MDLKAEVTAFLKTITIFVSIRVFCHVAHKLLVDFAVVFFVETESKPLGGSSYLLQHVQYIFD